SETARDRNWKVFKPLNDNGFIYFESKLTLLLFRPVFVAYFLGLLLRAYFLDLLFCPPRLSQILGHRGHRLSGVTSKWKGYTYSDGSA
ncbi:MAG: hypothetical protein ACI85S_001641, partial [Pseudohongiellaceae bacterium]